MQSREVERKQKFKGVSRTPVGTRGSMMTLSKKASCVLVIAMAVMAIFVSPTDALAGTGSECSEIGRCNSYTGNCDVCRSACMDCCEGLSSVWVSSCRIGCSRVHIVCDASQLNG